MNRQRTNKRLSVEKVTFYCINRKISLRATDGLKYYIIWINISKDIHYFSFTR
jgi:hypothetical protein